MKINTNIPIPKDAYKLLDNKFVTRMFEVIPVMNVGDSIDADKREWEYSFFAARESGFKIYRKKLSNKKIRIWRIE